MVPIVGFINIFIDKTWNAITDITDTSGLL